MNPETFKSFHRTHISEEDFGDALRFIRGARNFADMSTEYEALLISAIIAYARPFSGNERGENPPIDSRLAKDLVPFQGAQLSLHDRIVSARNKAVAHAESTHYPVEEMPPPEDAGGITYLTVSGKRWHISHLKLKLDEFEAIAKTMRERCSVHCFELAQASYLADGGGEEA